MSEPIRAVMALIWDSLGDWRKFLKAAKDNGANTLRMFVDYGVGGVTKMNPVHPFKLIGTWNPYAQAGADSRPDVPQFDLTQKEDACWAQLDEILAECGRLGLAVWADFRDHGSEPDEDWRRYLFSFYGNVQMWPGWQTPGYYVAGLEPAIPGGGIGEGLDQYHRQFYVWFMEACRKAGVKRVLGSPMNECGWPEAPACKLKDQARWIAAQAEALGDLGYEVVVSTGYTLTAEIVSSNVRFDFWDQHAVIDPVDIPGLPIPNSMVIYNTDGAWNGTGPGISCPPFEKHDASPEQMRALGEEAIRRRAAGVCFLSQQQIWSPDAPWNVDLVDMRPVRAMAEGLGWTPPEPPPPDKVRVTLCTLTYRVANPYCPTTFSEEFVAGTEPTQPCAYHKKPEEPKPKPWWRRLLEWLFGWL